MKTWVGRTMVGCTIYVLKTRKLQWRFGLVVTETIDISSKEIMFSVALVCLAVCLSVMQASDCPELDTRWIHDKGNVHNQL